MPEYERDTEVRYLGDDDVEVRVPPEARQPGDPEHERVPPGASYSTTAEQAIGLVDGGQWELVSGDRARELIQARAGDIPTVEADAYERKRISEEEGGQIGAGQLPAKASELTVAELDAAFGDREGY